VTIDFRVITVQRGGLWFAHAERTDNGNRFGIECSSESAEAAAARLTRWLDWQREHSSALEALQQAQRAYHRTIASRAFAGPTEGAAAAELQKESLERVETARGKLDEVRALRPE